MRVRAGKARKRSNKRLFKAARGYWGGRSRLLRTVSETLLRARAYATRDRRQKKRDYRALWITRIAAACNAREMSYSRFIGGLKAAGITLNRKALSEIAIHFPGVFDELVDAAKAAVKTSAA